MGSAETLGEAWNWGWRITMRCLDNGREGLKHRRRCDYRLELDLRTLVCTRERDFPLVKLSGCLRCPSCGCRDVAVMFSSPPTSNTLAAGVPRNCYGRE
jgi:hypothetical protein